VRKRRFLLAGLLALAALSAGLVAAAPARAADGSSSVGCSTGSSCYIELQRMIHFGALFDGHHAFAEAQQLVNANPMPAGEWYYLPVNPADNPAQVQDCLNQLPGVTLGGRWRALLDSR